jgi:signal transduction histidine kinase
MRDLRGLPIAAYLGILTALALAAAFVATLAIVIFLPPRPPDVMRADVVADNFQAGYDHMIALNRPMNERGMAWDIRANPPEEIDSPAMAPTRHHLAEALDLSSDQVVIKATNVVQSDVFVFRVQDVEGWMEDSEHAAEEAEHIAEEVRRAHEEATERILEARERMREAEEERQQAEEELRAEREAIAEARGEARAEAEAERQALIMEREAERQARAAEQAAERQAAIAERQAAAADRLRERLEQRIRIENGQVIIEQGSGAQRRVEVHTIPNVEDLDIRVPEVSVVTPPPPAPPAAPSPPSAPTRAAPPTSVAPPAPTVFAPAPAGVVLISGFEIGAQLPDGRWLVMRQGRNWAEIGWIARAAGIIGGTLLVLSILALLFARYLTRPIRSFADAVQAVGVNPQSEPVVEEGPLELRGAARAVNTMQARLRALIADRTKTLAAVAHDMRTPLMRLRLAAENAPPEQRERMAKEIGEVEALVASFIAFARDDPAEEPRVRLDIAALLQSIADDHTAQNRSVTFEGEERLIITGQSLGLKRLFGNLVENALKYGEAARIKLRVEENTVVADVEDDGLGIPAEQRESVFEPFVRLNEEGTRGAGLGLAAARSIARAHGGDIVILDAEKGALLRVTLPF